MTTGFYDTAEAFIAYAEQDFAKAEETAREKGVGVIAGHMPALISLVNVIGYLRGQDNMFDVKFSDPGYPARNSTLLKKENEFEKRLQVLIDGIMQSDQADYYAKRLESYFVKSRTNQKPDTF